MTCAYNCDDWLFDHKVVHTLECFWVDTLNVQFLIIQMSPEMAIVGTSTGNIYVLNSVGQTAKVLFCGGYEVMSISSDDDYISALAYDGVLTVWIKEGYIKWWQVNLVG